MSDVLTNVGRYRWMCIIFTTLANISLEKYVGYSGHSKRFYTGLPLCVSDFACGCKTLGRTRDTSAIFVGILYLSNVPIDIRQFSRWVQNYIRNAKFILKQSFACGFVSSVKNKIKFPHFSLQTAPITLADVRRIALHRVPGGPLEKSTNYRNF